jgi:hypothetical protein
MPTPTATKEERAYMAHTGIDLTAEAERLWQKWSDENG